MLTVVEVNILRTDHLLVRGLAPQDRCISQRPHQPRPLELRLLLEYCSDMSFFGFNTALPKDRTPAGEARGIFETPDPFAEVARATVKGDEDG